MTNLNPPDENKSSPLPEGWIWTTLGLIQIDRSRTIVPSRSPKQIFELYSVPSFEIGRPELIPGREIGSNKQIAEEDTVLLCKINPRINRVWIVGTQSTYTKIASTEWIPFFKHTINQKFLCYFMRNNRFRDFLATHASGVGGSLMRINANTFANYPIPLPPLNEQNRIVAMIEELFTKLDAGVKSLEKVKVHLKLYRQAVLKSAFEGKLTEEWRRTHRDELEPASKLLERIKEERRKSTTGKYRELTPVDTSSLPELPEGWIWTRIGEVVRIIDYRGRTPPFSIEGIPHLRSSNIRQGRISWENLEYVSEETYLKYMTRGLPQRGDLLFTTEAPLGEVALVPDQKFSVAQRIMILRPIKDVLNSKFLLYQIMFDRFQARLGGKGTGTTVRGVSSRNFRPVELVISPLAEQNRVVEEIERHFSVADEVEKTAVSSLRQAEKMRQSILKRAFEGKLVPQDPSDEPASILLERIKSLKVQVEQDQRRKKEECEMILDSGG